LATVRVVGILPESSRPRITYLLASTKARAAFGRYGFCVRPGDAA
jgi:hypothetical protein